MMNFPRGNPGLALLLLRFTVALELIQVATRNSTSGLAEVISAVSVVLGIGLMFGLYTSITSCIAGFGVLAPLILLHLVVFTSFATVGLLCVAVALAGPGGYSLDALLWGPRRVTFPERQIRNS